MAVIVYKNGQEDRVEAEYLHQALSAGWELEPKTAQPTHEDENMAVLEIAQRRRDDTLEEFETPTIPDLPPLPLRPRTQDEEPDIKPGSAKHVRMQAKMHGIDGWDSMSVNLLKKKLARIE